MERNPYKDVPSTIEASHDPLISLITSVPNPCDEAAALAFIARQHERLQTGQGWSLGIASGVHLLAAKWGSGE